jgi:hypothetical protein
MYRCPKCQERTISFTRKWLSAGTPLSGLSARCSYCKARSGIPVKTKTSIHQNTLLATGVAVLVSMLIWPEPWPIAVGICYYFWGYHRAPLVHVSPEFELSSKAAYRALYLPFCVVLVGVLLSGWLFAAITMVCVAVCIEYLAWSSRSKQKDDREQPDA